MPLNWDALAPLAGLASGNSVGEQFANMNNIRAAQQPLIAQRAQENKTLAYLDQYHKDIAAQVRAGMPMQNALQMVAKAQEPKKPNLLSAGNGFFYNADTGQYISPPSNFEGVDGGTSYGKQPIWFKDKDGNLRLGVPGDDGTLKMLDTTGFEPLPGIKTVDDGTGTTIIDSRTAAPVSRVEKDVAGQKEQSIVGEEIGKVKAALPSARQTAKFVSEQIDALIKDPALPQALGPLESKLPTMFATTANVESRMNLIEGQAFLQAREMLRGGGQITDFEGRKAEEAMARLKNRNLDPKDYIEALGEFKTAVQDGLAKLEAMGAGNLDYNPNAATPSGNVDDLVNKYRSK